MARAHGQAEVTTLSVLLAAERRVLGVPLSDVVRGGLKVLAVLALAVVTVRVARRAVPRAVGRLADASRGDVRWEQRTRTLSGTLVSVVGVVVWATAFVTVLGQLGLNLGPLLAGAGVVGLAVGFGAQQLVRDVISGFFVLVEDQYGVGDTVTAGGVTGTVESMTLRLTRIRGDDGVLHHLRNGDLGVVSNATRGYGVATAAVPFPATSDVEAVVERVRTAMAALVESGDVDGLLLADPQVLGVTGFRDPNAQPVLTVQARVRPEGKARVQRELLRRALGAVPEPPAKPARRRKPAS
ncbi:MAG TPA: mechanosensitive ion channel domain-containing protein [Frankiaceae bacterium]|nr:mechanosensitive ion channel domain-containing protein [Frankiaceae bacterium]